MFPDGSESDAECRNQLHEVQQDWGKCGLDDGTSCWKRRQSYLLRTFPSLFGTCPPPRSSVEAENTEATVVPDCFSNGWSRGPVSEGGNWLENLQAQPKPAARCGAWGKPSQGPMPSHNFHSKPRCSWLQR